MNLPILYPNLRDFSITSDVSRQYNCIAWAFGDTRRWWWPHTGYYWPRPYSLNEETVHNFVEVFADAGYEVCADGVIENGFEKIAIFAINGEPTHVARQLNTGRWTSKLGNLEDIDHAMLEEVECHIYGKVVTYMRRLRPSGERIEC